MRIFILLSLFTTGLAWAKLPAEKSPCNWGSNCVDYDGLDMVFKHGTNILNQVGVTSMPLDGKFYQRATGKTCQQAFNNAKEKMIFNHRELTCDRDFNGSKEELSCQSTWEGPILYRKSCMQSSKGEIVAWIICDRSGRSYTKTKPSSANPGLGLIMIKSLKKSEVRARASRN